MQSAKRTIGIVGGGSAGFTAARAASDRGARVLFFMGSNPDRASLCINAGCMPSKTLFAPIDELHRLRRRGFGEIGPLRPASYLEKISSWKDHEISRFRAFRQREITKREGDDFQIIRDEARFRDVNTLEAAGRVFEADAIILATGSTAVIPPIDGFAELHDEIWTNEEILDNRKLPESLTVLGGGAIGLEFSLRYARLGSRVTLVSRSTLLPGRAPLAGERLAKIYEKEGLRVLTHHDARRLYRDPDGRLILETEGPEGFEAIVGDRLLLATGRRPAVDTLGLDRIGVDPDDIESGPDMRLPGQSHIFAVGDLNKQRMVVHHAHIEAGIAAANAVDESDITWKRRANLQVVFTDPEFAAAGLDEDQARESGRDVVTASASSARVGKLHITGDEEGLAELIVDARDHAVLGAWLLCDDASELIHLPAYAIDHRHTVHELADAEYYHPTRIEIVSTMADRLCRKLGGEPYHRADE